MARKRIDLIYFRFSDFSRIYAADAAAAGVNLQHHLGRLLLVHRKEFLQHENHEIHRCEIIIEQKHLKSTRRAEFSTLGLKQSLSSVAQFRGCTFTHGV